MYDLCKVQMWFKHCVAYTHFPVCYFSDTKYTPVYDSCYGCTVIFLESADGLKTLENSRFQKMSIPYPLDPPDGAP